jgi:hypothetical protein
MTRLLNILTVFVLVSAAIGLASAQSDPRIGTWKLDIEKSKFAPAAARTGETRTYKLSGGAVMAHVEGTSSNGSKDKYSYDATPDGKDHPYITGNPGGADALSGKRKGNGFTFDNKKGGKVLYTVTATFSPDGRVMTLTTKGMNAAGQSINSVRVYDKQ